MCVSLHTYTYLVPNPKVAESTRRSRPGRSIPALQGFQGPNQWLEGLFKNWPHHGPAMGSWKLVVPAMVPCLESKHKEQKQLEMQKNYSTIILKIYWIRILTCKLIAIYGLFNEFCSWAFSYSPLASSTCVVATSQYNRGNQDWQGVVVQLYTYHIRIISSSITIFLSRPLVMCVYIYIYIYIYIYVCVCALCARMIIYNIIFYICIYIYTYDIWLCVCVCVFSLVI